MKTVFALERCYLKKNRMREHGFIKPVGFNHIGYFSIRKKAEKFMRQCVADSYYSDNHGEGGRRRAIYHPFRMQVVLFLYGGRHPEQLLRRGQHGSVLWAHPRPHPFSSGRHCGDGGIRRKPTLHCGRHSTHRGGLPEISGIMRGKITEVSPSGTDEARNCP